MVAGHANVQTDIKEATFMGSHDDLVAAGSDDGSVYIYEAVSGQVVKILQADEDVANCVQVCFLLVKSHNKSHVSALFSQALLSTGCPRLGARPMLNQQHHQSCFLMCRSESRL